VLVATVVVLGPIVYGVSPTEQNLMATLKPPSAVHPFGTDQYGRDVLARILHGGRVSLASAAVIVAAALSIGGVLGWLAASDHVVGQVLTRAVDTLLSLPGLIVALAVVGALGVGLGNLVIAFVLVGWPWYARIVRGFALERRKGLDVLASRAFGVSEGRIFWNHILPHAIRTLGIIAALDLGYTIAGLSGFSYLGLGAQPPAAEWGAMLDDAQLYFTVAPWLLLGPAAGIALTVLASTLMAEHLHGQGLAR
jgi:ABC-type dipeptide/oligopeptide/nickel transport system permease subunit